MPGQNIEAATPPPLTGLGMLHRHLEKAAETFPSMFRYLILFLIVTVPTGLIAKLYIDFSHDVVIMAMNNTTAPWGLRLCIAVVVCGMPTVVFRPRIAVKLVRALATLARTDRGNNQLPPAP